MMKNNPNNQPAPEEQKPAAAPVADGPSRITPPTVAPYEKKKKGMRASEVIIIIAIIFGIAICGLLIWGVIAFFKNIPEWWRELFGYLGYFAV